jgi:xylulokinase
MTAFMLGVDLGTTGLKTALVRGTGEVIAEASQEYTTHYPYPNWAEQDPEDWWQALCTTVNQVMAAAPKPSASQSLTGISISSQAPVVVPMSATGQPLMRGIIWADKRAEAECEVLRTAVGEARVREITANSISSFLAAPTYIWLQRHRPDLFRATHCFLMANSYLNFRLTGRYTMDVSESLLQLLVDARTCDWSPELMAALNLPFEKFPRIFSCLDVIGQVDIPAAAALGIPVGTPVLAGTTDTTAAMVGMGIVHGGQAFVSHGTGSNIGLCVTQPKPNRHLICIPHAIPGYWMLSAVMTSTGASVKWFVNELCEHECEQARRAGADVYSLVTADVGASPPGSGGVVFLPYLMGEQAPIWDANARGVFVGISATTTRGDLVRAIMEGITFGVRQNLQVYLDDGWTVGDIRVQGGATRNALWNQMLADVTGRTVVVPAGAAGAPLGNALLVGLATGIYATPDDAAAVCPPPKAVYVPDPATAAVYERLYPVYERLYGALAGTFDDLATFRRTTQLHATD